MIVVVFGIAAYVTHGFGRATVRHIHQQGYTSPTYRQQGTANVSQSDPIATFAPLQRRRLHRVNRPHATPQIAQSAKSSADAVLQDANLDVANPQKGFATGYRPLHNAGAKPQNTNLQIADETDRKIVAAAEQLRMQDMKVTGSAIAEITGIAERTVYDRMKKMQGK